MATDSKRGGALAGTERNRKAIKAPLEDVLSVWFPKVDTLDDLFDGSTSLLIACHIQQDRGVSLCSSKLDDSEQRSQQESERSQA